MNSPILLTLIPNLTPIALLSPQRPEEAADGGCGALDDPADASGGVAQVAGGVADGDGRRCERLRACAHAAHLGRDEERGREGEEEGERDHHKQLDRRERGLRFGVRVECGQAGLERRCEGTPCVLGRDLGVDGDLPLRESASPS